MPNEVEDRYRRSRRRSRDEVCGEKDPGFSLWTSAHGFHHYTLTDSLLWRVIWVIIVLVCCICLIGCVIYYFYYVFRDSIYSRIIVEDGVGDPWPATIVCEKRAFQQQKVQQVIGLSQVGISFLTWSLGPNLARPEVFDANSIKAEQARGNLDFILARDEFDGDHQRLIEAISPTCQELIVECKVSSETLTAAECCGQIFNPDPIFNQYGTCFSTVGASRSLTKRGAGEINGLQVVTKHEDFATFDPDIAHPDLIDAKGVAFAVVGQHDSPETALRTQGQSAEIGTINSIGMTRSVIDNRDLEVSLIGRKECIAVGSRDSDKVDPDFLIGLDSSYGYTSGNCQTSKTELLARNELSCTFNTDSTTTRCSPDESVTFYRSFIDVNATSTNRITVESLSESMQERYEKECPQDCFIDRYSLTTSSSVLSDELKADLAAKIEDTSFNVDVVVLRFFMNNLEYQRIHNFPQHGLQFLAEIGGLMAFFLGISVISIFECLFYAAFCLFCRCCGRRCSRDDDIDEELPPPRSRNHDHY